MGYLHKELTKKIINGFFNVYNRLGYGFLEKVYERALTIELEKMGLKVSTQHPVKVYYDGKIIAGFFADMVVDDKVIVELKAVKQLTDAHEIQLVNYLKATDIEIGLVLNFGEQPEIRRRIVSNNGRR